MTGDWRRGLDFGGGVFAVDRRRKVRRRAGRSDVNVAGVAQAGETATPASDRNEPRWPSTRSNAPDLFFFFFFSLDPAPAAATLAMPA